MKNNKDNREHQKFYSAAVTPEEAKRRKDLDANVGILVYSKKATYSHPLDRLRK
ncbi:hypothetical protein ACIQLG_16680 [Terribacillus saccharophilus]|uniref:hypothetical protein n=1 Tax=Terribacillus saccharophilus TaxID=361277 RepID=UPI00380CE51B